MSGGEASLRRDLEAALKARDKTAAKVLRNILASLANRRIELKLAAGAELEAKELMAIVKREAKQTREALEFAEKGDRGNLAEEARAELEVIERMLPSQLTGEALAAEIAKIIESTGADSMGPVMKELGVRHDGAYDGREASGAVRAALEKAGR